MKQNRHATLDEYSAAQEHIEQLQALAELGGEEALAAYSDYVRAEHQPSEIPGPHPQILAEHLALLEDIAS